MNSENGIFSEISAAILKFVGNGKCCFSRKTVRDRGQFAMMTRSEVKPQVRCGSDIALGLWGKVKGEQEGHKLI